MSDVGTRTLLEGRAAIDTERVLHVTRRPGLALCGAETVAYLIRWDTTTVIACRKCIDIASESAATVA